MVLQFRLSRLRAFLAGNILPDVDWSADVRHPTTWTDLAERIRHTRLPEHVYMSVEPLARAVQTVADHLDASHLEALRTAHARLGELMTSFDRAGYGRDAGEAEAARWAADEDVVGRLANEMPPELLSDEVLPGLLRLASLELPGGAFSVRRSERELASFLLATCRTLEAGSKAQARLELLASMAVPLLLGRTVRQVHMGLGVLGLFQRGALPARFTDRDAPPRLLARDLIWPVVLETQRSGFPGLPYGSTAGRRCWRTGTLEERSAVVVGVAQLAVGAVAVDLPYPQAMLDGLAALAERTAAEDLELVFTPEQQVVLDTLDELPGWLRPRIDTILLRTLGRTRPVEKVRRGRVRYEAEVRGLRGGTLLWPLVEHFLNDPSWISWRSDPPCCARLLRAPSSQAGHVTVGIQQLLRTPERFGLPLERMGAMRRILRGFKDKRVRWFSGATLDEGDQAVLDSLGSSILR